MRREGRTERPLVIRRVAGLGALVVLGLAALLPAGCRPKPRFVQGGDSTGVAYPDSFAFYVGEAQQGWDSTEPGDQAAAWTARALMLDLGVHPDVPVQSRLEAIIDSLNFGAEVMGGMRFAVTNLFERSDPEGNSWPFALWRDPKGVRVQALAGRGLHLTALAPRDLRSDGNIGDSTALALLYTRRAGAGQQPLLMVWGRRGGRWELSQTLGADSLGGTGTGEFSAAPDGSIELVTRTYRGTRGFEECQTCPHFYRTRRFAWQDEGFVKMLEKIESSPYTSFVQLIDALRRGDADAAEARVGDREVLEFAKRSGWSQDHGPWRVAPSTDESASEMVFFRGPDEAYRVRFTPRGDEWVVAGAEVTQRTVE